jgi:pSer/pThr/pTyr-binding forkhead associated (FHA) protein/outer membrane biosynthesis protein TonB
VEIQKNKQQKMFELRPTSSQAKTNIGVFPKGRLLLGRTESCDLVVNNDSVSAVHAVMEIFDDKAILYDMNSTNGTYVNDDKIIVKELHVGDFFRLADVEFEFQVYNPEDALPPVLDTLEPALGEASVKVTSPLTSGPPAAPKVLPKAAPSVSAEMPSIVYPLASDPKAEFSEYIFEDKEELYPIFKYESTKQAVEVIILFKDSVFSVDYLPEGKNTYYISGLQTKSHEELEFPYLGKTERFPFVEVRSGHAVVHTLPGFGVFLLSDKKKDTGHVGTDVELQGQDLLRLQKGDLQIFVRNVQSPPQVAHAPILKRDPEFRKYLAIFLFFVGLITTSFQIIEVPEDERKDELAPERLATILYKQRLTVADNPLVDKTEKAPKIAQKSPTQTAVEKPTKPEAKPEKKPDVMTTKVQNKKPDPGKKTAIEKKIVKQGSTPVTKPDNRVYDAPAAKGTPQAAGTKSPTAFSQIESKSVGHVEVYKSADFTSSVSSLVAKGGSLSGVKTQGAVGSGSATGMVGVSNGVVGGSGTVKTSTIVTNQGSLVGAASGVLGESKGAEGLSAKRMIYTAGIPNETVVLGSMDPDVVRRRLMEYLPQFRSCYQKELETTRAEINGTIKLNFVIGSSGHVSKAGIDGSTPLPRDVSACVINVLRGITFPEPLGGGVVEVKQPMNFQPKKI